LPQRKARDNPYFAFQPYIRMASNTTTRSNVYAVWITVGYFEVEPATGGAPDVFTGAEYADGYRLGLEEGFDNGAIRRSRAFYLFDRTKPMGYWAGHALNLEDGILIERVIE
jgi:hypothetical protein